MNLIPNWQASWRFISMQATAARGAAEGAFVMSLAILSPEQRDRVVAFFSAHIGYVFAAMFVLTFAQGFGRLIQQTPPQEQQGKP